MTEKIQKLLESTNPEDVVLGVLFLYRNGEINTNTPNIRTPNCKQGMNIEFPDISLWKAPKRDYISCWYKGMWRICEPLYNFEDETRKYT